MLNNVSLMGRFTKDPELKKTTQNLSTVSFTLAVDRDFGKNETDFINCVAWRQTADFISKYFHKGSLAGVTGRIQVRSYEKDGQKRTVTEVLVDSAYFGGGKNEAPQETEVTFENTDEELPF